MHALPFNVIIENIQQRNILSLHSDTAEQYFKVLGKWHLCRIKDLKVRSLRVLYLRACDRNVVVTSLAKLPYFILNSCIMGTAKQVKSDSFKALN